MYRHFFKRFIDIVISVIGLVVASVIMLVVAILIKLESPGEVIFKQPRIGKNGKVFNIYKFRSMCKNAEKTGSGVYSDKNDSRVTKVGKFLRATSIDEIPQLVNILKGDMSLDVRPGITGWAQVHGRKQVEWHQRIELNIWYVEHLSFLLDLKILFMTIFKVFTNADNENVGATLVKDNQEDKIKDTETVGR